MFSLYDVFNKRVISRHRSLVAVVREKYRLEKKSGTPTTVRRDNGDAVSGNEMHEFWALCDEFRHSPIKDIR